jgi:hypothetical protein
MAQFKVKSVLPGFKRLFGMTAEVYNENGDLLKSVDLNNSRKRFTLKVDKEDALDGSKNAELSIKLIDNNGDDLNFTKRSGASFDLGSDEQTFTTTIKANKKRSRAKLRPTTDIVDTGETDIVDTGETDIDDTIENGKTISLTPLLDTITANDLSAQSDTITAELGTLGVDFQDSVVDGSSSDNDLLKITTNGAFDLHESLDASEINRVQNIETIQVVANNDDLGGEQEIDLSKIVNLKTLDVDGTFTDELEFDGWALTGATEFDFSDITSTNGVFLIRAKSGDEAFSKPLILKGSQGSDFLHGVNGDATIQGFAGDDFLAAPNQGKAILEGGSGQDVYNLGVGRADAQHTIRLHGQISETSRDTIFGDDFHGFNSTNAQALNTFDLVEIDAITFSNYTANQDVQQQNINNISANTNLNNIVVTAATQAGLEAKNFDNNGNGILGFAADTGMLLFSASGNFARDAQELLEIGAVEGANFVPVQQINVV